MKLQRSKYKLAVNRKSTVLHLRKQQDRKHHQHIGIISMLKQILRHMETIIHSQKRETACKKDQ